MSFKDLLRRVVSPPSSTPDTERRDDEGEGEEGYKEIAERWLDAMKEGRLNPPRDVHDAADWNRYWSNHLAVGPIELIFADQMSSNPGLIDLLVRRGVSSVLCAGNGLSTEALALALHGFHVTALDISSVTTTGLLRMLSDPAHRLRAIPGFSVEGPTVRFGTAGPIAADLCPPIHRSTAHTPKAGGSLTLVTGDLSTSTICPGPFDAVIERRTLQLFPRDEQAAALKALTERLAAKGTFISHQHSGGGFPGKVSHYADGCIEALGFVLPRQADPQSLDTVPRLASLHLSTG